MEKFQILSKILFSIAIIYFSTAVIITVNEASQTREALPGIIQQVQTLEKNSKIANMLNQTSKLVSEIAEIRKQIPAILEEVKATRNAVPLIVNEVALVRQQIPEILQQVEATREIVPDILQEVSAVRKEAPLILKQTENLLAQAEKASNNFGEGAVEGAVEGVIKGVLKTPFNILETGINEVNNTRKLLDRSKK